MSAPILGISYSHRKVVEFLTKRGDILCLSADQYCLHHSDHHVDFSIEEKNKLIDFRMHVNNRMHKMHKISVSKFSYKGTVMGVRSLFQSFTIKKHNNIFLPHPIKTKSTASKTP